MKFVTVLILTLSVSCLWAQDSLQYFQGWGKPFQALFVPLDSLSNQAYTQVKFESERPVLMKRYTAQGDLQSHVENSYDSYGNHVSKREYDAQGQLREELIFKNDPEQMALFRTIFGSTFNPANSNFMIRKEYNEYGRETGYFIVGVTGENLYSRVTTYRDDRRKAREVLTDDLKHQTLADRRYKYDDAADRTVLEEFNGDGKLIQRVVLFDQHEIIDE